MCAGGKNSIVARKKKNVKRKYEEKYLQNDGKLSFMINANKTEFLILCDNDVIQFYLYSNSLILF